MEKPLSKDPLHGITLQKILEKLVDYYGFDTLGELINILRTIPPSNRV
jgi:uncharacterized protein (DUF2132 family)